MARLLTPGGDDNAWGDVLNEYLSVVYNSDGILRGVDILFVAASTALDNITYDY